MSETVTTAHAARSAAKATAAASWQWLAPAVEMAAVVTGHWPLAREPSTSGWTSLPRVATRTQGAGIGSVRAARDFTAATLRRWGIGEYCDDVVVVVSELVTNALRHATPAVVHDGHHGANGNGRLGANGNGHPGGNGNGHLGGHGHALTSVSPVHDHGAAGNGHRVGFPHAAGPAHALSPVHAHGPGSAHAAGSVHPAGSAQGPAMRPRPVRLALLLQPGPCVLCAVSDPSDRAPVVREAGWFGETGRGLHVVACLSDEWGWTLPSPAGKVVWAMFSRPR